MGRPSRETIMTALYAVLQASAQVSFTANTVLNSVALGNPSTLAGLFVGLPVFGVGVPRGATIATLTPTLTITQAATANGTAVPLVTGFLTTSRRLKRWSDVAAQPALFLLDGDEEIAYPRTILQVQTMSAMIVIYANAGQNPEAVPAAALNSLLDAVSASFAPDDVQSNRFTLGGLVEWCRIVGKISKGPGDTADQALAVADVEITVP